MAMFCVHGIKISNNHYAANDLAQSALMPNVPGLYSLAAILEPGFLFEGWAEASLGRVGFLEALMKHLWLGWTKGWSAED